MPAVEMTAAEFEALRMRVRVLARTLLPRMSANVEFDDLLQDANVGMLDALRNYDPSMGASIETHAQSRASGEMLDGLRRMDVLSRRGRAVHTAIERADRHAWQFHGRRATDAERAAEAGISLAQYFVWVGTTAHAGVAGNEVGPDEDDEIEDQLPADESWEPEAAYLRKEYVVSLQAALQTLPVRHRQVIERYFFGDEPQHEIATAIGVTESRVCQLIKSACATMRRAMRMTAAEAPAL